MKPIQNSAVAAKFQNYPPKMRPKLMALRKIILQTAANTAEVGEIEETLKWGEPAYLTSQSGSGSTIRIDWKRSRPEEYAMYFNCNTNLVDTFRTMFPNDFKYEGNRALVFEANAPIPTDALRFCIAAASTYHRTKQNQAQSPHARTDA